MQNNVIRGGEIPIVITYRHVTKRPVIKRHHYFVGWKRLGLNLFEQAIKFVDAVAYDIQNEEIEAGEQRVVHWAISVDDPWTPNTRSNLVVSRVPHLPAAGAHFEIIRVEDGEGQQNEGPQVARRPPNHEATRKNLRKALQRDGHFDSEAGLPEDDAA